MCLMADVCDEDLPCQHDLLLPPVTTGKLLVNNMHNDVAIVTLSYPKPWMG
jgi:hypothetical protein